jgi:hypothetical protein
MYCLFVNVYWMCIVLLPPADYPTAVKKYIIQYIISYHIISYHIISYHIISYHIISYHIISYQSYHIISYIISYHIISYHISYHIISYIIYHIISYRIIPSYLVMRPVGVWTFSFKSVRILFLPALPSAFCTYRLQYFRYKYSSLSNLSQTVAPSKGSEGESADHAAWDLLRIWSITPV